MLPPRDKDDPKHQVFDHCIARVALNYHFLSHICRKYRRLADALEGVQSEEFDPRAELFMYEDISWNLDDIPEVWSLLLHCSCTLTQLLVIRRKTLRM